MEHVRRLPDILDHVDDVEDHRDVHAVRGGARFHEVELRLGAVDERDPALAVLGVLALRRRIRCRVGWSGAVGDGSHRSTLPQPPLRIPDHRINQDRLGRLTGTAAVPVHATSTAGGAQRDPVGGAVATPVVAAGVHQRLHEPGLEVVVARPVHHQLPEAARQDGAGEVPHRDPRQQQEAAVVDHALEIPRPSRVVPADPAVPGPSSSQASFIAVLNRLAAAGF